MSLLKKPKLYGRQEGGNSSEENRLYQAPGGLIDKVEGLKLHSIRLEMLGNEPESEPISLHRTPYATLSKGGQQMSYKRKIRTITIILVVWLIWFLLFPRDVDINQIIISFGIIGLYIWSVIWAYEDAAARGKPGGLVALLVALLGWPVSLALWLVIRPERLAP